MESQGVRSWWGLGQNIQRRVCADSRSIETVWVWLGQMVIGADRGAYGHVRWGLEQERGTCV
eukprot:13376069-Ditylum_brightwellii.AAC.1